MNFRFNFDKKLEYSFFDKDGNNLVISCDEELTLALANKEGFVLDVKEHVGNY